MFHYLLLPFGISTTLSPQRLATFKQATGLFLSFPSFFLSLFFFIPLGGKLQICCHCKLIVEGRHEGRSGRISRCALEAPRLTLHEDHMMKENQYALIISCSLNGN